MEYMHFINVLSHFDAMWKLDLLQVRRENNLGNKEPVGWPRQGREQINCRVRLQALEERLSKTYRSYRYLILNYDALVTV